MLVAFLVGAVIASFLPFNLEVNRNPVYLFIGLGIIFSIFLNFIFKNRYLALIGFCLLSSSASIAYYDNFDRYQSKPEIPEEDIVGKIVSRPVSDLKDQTFVVSITNYDRRKLAVRTSIIPEYQYGDLLTISGKLLKTKEQATRYSQKLHHDLVPFSVDFPEIELQTTSNKTAANLFFRTSYNFVNHFENSLNQILTEPHSSLAAGLILGIKRNIPDSLMNSFQTVGLTHIIALSGYNISVILVIFTSFLVVYLGRKKIFFYGIFFIIFFVFITGASQSIVRAAIVSILLLFARTIGRKADQANLILFSAFIMVLFNPYVITKDIGFQLSFSAFAGLVYLSEPIKSFLEKRKIPGFISNPLSETLSAQLAVLPLIFFYFRQVSLIAPISNILVLWTIPLAMFLSFVSGFVGLFSVTIGRYVAFLAWPCLEYIIKITEFLSKLPGAAIQI